MDDIKRGGNRKTVMDQEQLKITMVLVTYLMTGNYGIMMVMVCVCVLYDNNYNCLRGFLCFVQLFPFEYVNSEAEFEYSNPSYRHGKMNPSFISVFILSSHM